MIIAKTQEESDLLCEQEISHVLRIERQVPIISKGEHTVLIDNEKERLVFLPERENTVYVKTKKYGSLVYFERIQELLDSKYNKAVMCVYCSSIGYESRKKYTLKAVNIETKEESYEFKSVESSDNNFARIFVDKDYETNKIKEIEPYSAYLIVIQRDSSAINGVRIIDSYKINSKN